MSPDEEVALAAPVYVVSGGIGTVGEQIARLALSQFEETDVPVIIVPNVRESQQVIEVVQKAASNGGTILHTLMETALRRELMRQARDYNVVEVDLVGTVLSRLATAFGKDPVGKPGLYHQRRATHFDRLEAIEFTMRHDDGAGVIDLDQAEIVLVGISRSGKTPLSMYLAVMGWKVANIPLVKDIPPPKELLQLDRRRVIGLFVDAEQITARRRWRQRRIGVSLGQRYTDMNAAEEEVEWAKRLYRRQGWAMVNLTDHSIEESADEIIALITRWFKHQEGK
ncbi:MAG: kinase/pyrophosphorylase [Oscillochloris sp.]|nr:kinase/pyrophosphorylase [Oscillochloris sp.]